MLQNIFQRITILLKIRPPKERRIEFPAELLRSPENTSLPDPRNEGFVVFSPEGTRPFTLIDHHSHIVSLELHSGVPETVRFHFETTKNIYLYSWFVYRFYPVALHYSLVSLEFALRERFEAEMIALGEEKREHGPGLKRLLRFSIEGGHLKNEDFGVWRHMTEMRARHRTSQEITEKMIRENLTEVEYDEDDFEIKAIDRDHEFVKPLIDLFPNLRNHYAHGSRTLHNQALVTIQIVSEIINQIFVKPRNDVNSLSA